MMDIKQVLALIQLFAPINEDPIYSLIVLLHVMPLSSNSCGAWLNIAPRIISFWIMFNSGLTNLVSRWPQMDPSKCCFSCGLGPGQGPSAITIMTCSQRSGLINPRPSKSSIESRSYQLQLDDLSLWMFSAVFRAPKVPGLEPSFRTSSILMQYLNKHDTVRLHKICDQRSRCHAFSCCLVLITRRTPQSSGVNRYI